MHHLVGGALAPYAAGSSFGAFVARFLSGLTSSGVELFFVLSAVVLARPYVKAPSRFQLGQYLKRRAERLWPPYVAAWLLAGLVIFVTSAWPNWWSVTASLPPFDFFHWLTQFGLLYWGHQAYNFAWWSLNLEVLFYVLMPLMLPIFSLGYKHHGVAVLAYAASVVLAAAATSLPLWEEGAFQILARFIPYASCFVGGLYIATTGSSFRGGWLWAGFGLAWVVGCEAWALTNPHIGWGLFYLVLVAKVLKGGCVAKLFSAPDAVWLGERSYSLFLTHYSVIALVCWLTAFWLPDKNFAYFLITRVLSIVFSMGVAVMVFQLVERRFARNLVSAEQILPPFANALSAFLRSGARGHA
jgi:peptidoglycan/LPS O-acetylase OafA/YrhL